MNSIPPTRELSEFDRLPSDMVTHCVTHSLRIIFTLILSDSMSYKSCLGKMLNPILSRLFDSKSYIVAATMKSHTLFDFICGRQEASLISLFSK